MSAEENVIRVLADSLVLSTIGCPTCDHVSGRVQIDICGNNASGVTTIPDGSNGKPDFRTTNRNETPGSKYDIYRCVLRIVKIEIDVRFVFFILDRSGGTHGVLPGTHQWLMPVVWLAALHGDQMPRRKAATRIPASPTTA